jgi:CheY-like chemotaxis protein
MLLKDKRIFITEDNLGNRSIMQLLLEQEGATVSFERWGRDTKKRLETFAPVDVILLDLMLPNNISGLDVFEQIREMPDMQDVPIIAVSAKTADIAIPETRSKGFNGFISKPIDYTLFARQIASIIEGEVVWYSR